ncbi:MAG: O-antigen ligase family protein [Bacteroidetes bacterium]|nr:O-antigen ligase family protein [Bacteroidota bacterium]
MVTLSLILLAVFWLVQQPSKQNFKLLAERRMPLVIIACCLVFIVRCLWQLPSDDTIGEIQRWAVFAVFMLIFGSMQSLNHRQFFAIVCIYTASVVICSVFNFVYFILNEASNVDVRRASIFMWYIRFVLFCLMGVAICVYYLLFQKHIVLPRYAKILFLCGFVWLVFYLIFIKSITGYVGLLILCLLSIYERIRQYKKYDFLVVFFVIFTILGVRVGYEAHFFLNPDEIDIEKLDTHTKQGNKYWEFEQRGFIENGHWNNLYICRREIVDNWHLYSDVPLFETNVKGFAVYDNLKRYMTSKNLRKDAEGLAQLTAEDIRNIEKGYTNYRFTSQFKLSSRIYESLEEGYMKSKGSNSQGKSIMQRIVFWRVSFNVFLENKLFGSGPKYYQEKLHAHYAHIGLDEKYWHQTHNQFLRILTTYGIVGFVCFVLTLLCIPIFSRKKMTMLSVAWYSIFVISMTNDDTLVSLYGIMFVSLFCGLFLCVQPDRK